MFLYLFCAITESRTSSYAQQLSHSVEVNGLLRFRCMILVMKIRRLLAREIATFASLPNDELDFS